MATANEAGTTTFTTPSDREVVMTRVFDAPRTLVFDAFTDPEHLRNWLLGPPGWTMPICEVDLRSGGAYRYGWRKDDGAEMQITGTYREVEPPERLVSTESWGEDWPDTVNTVVFSEEEGRTRVSTTLLYPSKEARDAALETGMKDGANASYDRLAEYLGTLAKGA